MPDTAHKYRLTAAFATDRPLTEGERDALAGAVTAQVAEPVGSDGVDLDVRVSGVDLSIDGPPVAPAPPALGRRENEWGGNDYWTPAGLVRTTAADGERRIYRLTPNGASCVWEASFSSAADSAGVLLAALKHALAAIGLAFDGDRLVTLPDVIGTALEEAP